MIAVNRFRGALAVILCAGLSASVAEAGPGLVMLQAGARGAPSRASTPDMAWLAGHPDYAPGGMPDFSQCRREWSQPGSPGQWTHAAPAALADALWWLDSAAEPAPRPPSEPNDGHALVAAYPRFGPPVDDHSADNVRPLVEDFARRANTDGQREPRFERGTRWEDLVPAIRQYLAFRRLDGAYSVEQTAPPSTAWLALQTRSGAGVVLLLGVWEEESGIWRRVGGHYVALAGASATGDAVAVADPLADFAALTGVGRVAPADPGLHSCRTAPRSHDDAGVISHDLWTFAPVPDLPDRRLVLQGYFAPDTYGEAAAFRGQNTSLALAEHVADWRGGTVVMAIDAGVAVVPSGVSGATPTASVTPTATPSPPGEATTTPTEEAPTETPAATEHVPSPSPTGSSRGIACFPLVLRGG